MFVVSSEAVEAIRSNQKLHELKPKYTATSVAASGSTVAVGGEDQKVRLYEWDGKALKEVAVLENNKGSVSALAFSPDGSLLAAGDVSSLKTDIGSRELTVSLVERQSRSLRRQGTQGERFLSHLVWIHPHLKREPS